MKRAVAYFHEGCRRPDGGRIQFESAQGILWRARCECGALCGPNDLKAEPVAVEEKVSA